MSRIENLHIRGLEPLVSPAALKSELPLNDAAMETVVSGRDAVKAVLAGRDERLMVVVGPCSIHDEKACLEYADKLVELRARVDDRLLILMRAYFEKPRTRLGWKGLINDPHLDGSLNIPEGLRSARRVLLALGERGLPTASEMLDPITPQYISDLLSWASIGARTTESQTHRQMASGLSMPIGYKNSTEGDVDVAINALAAAAHPHSFLGIDQDGRTCIVNTRGNPWGCVIVRGGRTGPNFSAEHLEAAGKSLRQAGLPSGLIIDCSHANSSKDYKRQRVVWESVVQQRVEGSKDILGLMLESNLNPGRQDLGDDPGALAFGVSITDACVGWDETEDLILAAHASLASVRTP